MEEIYKVDQEWGFLNFASILVDNSLNIIQNIRDRNNASSKNCYNRSKPIQLLFNKTEPTTYLIGNVELIEGDGRHSDKLILRVTKTPNLQN